MLKKRSIIVGLIGLNLLLLAGLIVFSYSPSAAYAQSRGRAGDFMMATIQMHPDYDAVAVINGPAGGMYVFRPQSSNQGVKLVLTGSQDLLSDMKRR